MSNRDKSKHRGLLSSLSVVLLVLGLFGIAVAWLIDLRVHGHVYWTPVFQNVFAGTLNIPLSLIAAIFLVDFQRKREFSRRWSAVQSSRLIRAMGEVENGLNSLSHQVCSQTQSVYPKELSIDERAQNILGSIEQISNCMSNFAIQQAGEDWTSWSFQLRSDVESVSKFLISNAIEFANIASDVELVMHLESLRDLDISSVSLTSNGSPATFEEYMSDDFDGISINQMLADIQTAIHLWGLVIDSMCSDYSREYRLRG